MSHFLIPDLELRKVAMHAKLQILQIRADFVGIISKEIKRLFAHKCVVSRAVQRDIQLSMQNHRILEKWQLSVEYQPFSHFLAHFLQNCIFINFLILKINFHPKFDIIFFLNSRMCWSPNVFAAFSNCDQICIMVQVEVESWPTYDINIIKGLVVLETL